MKSPNLKCLLIDHDDSFTQNLKHWLRPLFQTVQVIHHLEFRAERPDLRKLDLQRLEKEFDLFVFSPGPKSPQDYPHSLEVLKKLNATTPVYGVCLGLQMMVVSEQQMISTYAPPKHGKKSRLQMLSLKNSALQDSEVARYHSIKASFDRSSKFDVIAQSADDQHPMWVRHQMKKWMAVQFHPESFLTENAELHLEALKEWLLS